MANNGQTVEFPSNGDTASGYLATPPSDGAGPGVVVIQEWWGLVPQIRAVCDELATEGFTALAPDLYHGDIAEHDEMDKAGHLMSTLPMDRAARDMVGAVDYLLGHDLVRGHAVGVVGFCMGGMLTLALAARAGDKIGAAVPYYGAPLGENEPDWSGLTAPVLGHYAENDDFFPPDAVKALGEKLTDMGKDVTLFFYPGTGHAFANETNALGTYDEDAKRQAWVRTLEFLRAKLG
jgi:carboxymethylenebutenolidase